MAFVKPDDLTIERKIGRAASRGPVIAGVAPFVLLHGTGGAYDEIAIFGGIGLVILALVFLSWRAGRDKKRREKRRRRKPQG